MRDINGSKPTDFPLDESKSILRVSPVPTGRPGRTC